jgi:hypothetical protein
VSALERIVGLPYRLRFRWRNRGRERKQFDTLRAVRNLFEKAESIGLHNTRRIHNVALYALLLDQDLWQFNSDMVLAVGEHRRQFVARHLAVLLYEGSQQLPELLGTDYRESLRAVGVPDTGFEELNGVSAGFNRSRIDIRKHCKRSDRQLQRIAIMTSSVNSSLSIAFDRSS